MKFAKHPPIKNQVPLYEFYISGDQNPFKWIWFPQYKSGSRTIETHINKTLCEPTWRRQKRPEIGFLKYTDTPFSTERIQFTSKNDKFEKLGWQDTEWSADNLVYITPHVFDNMEQIEEHFKFTFVRNPYDRLVSCWNDKRYDGARNKKSKAELTFEQFVDQLVVDVNKKYDGDIAMYGNPHVKSQSGMLQSAPLDFIGHLETFDVDWKKICDHFNVQPAVENIHQNKTKRKAYHEYYNDRTKQIVTELYAEDIEIFGYEY